MTWKVTAPLALAADERGQTHHVYAGGVIDWLSDAQRDHFLAEGLVVEVDTAAAAPGAAGDGKPDEHATKAALIDWLVDNAEHADGSAYTEAELRPLNKEALWDLVGAVD